MSNHIIQVFQNDLNIYVMDLRPLEIFPFFQCCDHLYTPQSDINRHQVVTYKEGPRNVRVKDKTTCIIKRLLFTCLGMVIPLNCCIKNIADIAYIDRFEERERFLNIIKCAVRSRWIRKNVNQAFRESCPHFRHYWWRKSIFTLKICWQWSSWPLFK